MCEIGISVIRTEGTTGANNMQPVELTWQQTVEVAVTQVYTACTGERLIW